MTKISNNKPVYDLEEITLQLNGIFSSYWKNQHSFGHWDLEFGVYLEFDAWNFPVFNKPVTLFTPNNYLFK